MVPDAHVTQLGLWQSLWELMWLKPALLWGIVPIAALLLWVFRRDKSVPRIKTTILSLLLYDYLCVALTNIIGMPTLAEWRRLLRLGEAVFNPNVNWIPLRDGISLSLLLNVLLFIPFGFLCPWISKTFGRARNICMAGLGLSLLIELMQLFTLYRATDIDDILTNGMGTLIGYAGFRLLEKLRLVKASGGAGTAWLPGAAAATALILGFWS
ncbi:MAG: VanZ family protein [Agathobaculum sp.]|jgi:glycopeptide antibiotics resistance protein|uniref:VanZ family protein n=1 Tax=Agathobaculum sp. TaxID=2048138 RepID=UPI003D94336C